MDNQIRTLSHFYADKGAQMGDSIQKALLKYEVEIINKTPLSIEFIPWAVGNSMLDKSIRGFILWNPFSDIIIIQNYLHLSHSAKENTTFSRCLKWYLYKWNESRSYAIKKLGATFLYPAADNSEVLLQVKCKASLHQINKRIRMSLLQMNDIIESEGETLISILSGTPPVEFKKEIFEEIFYILSEMN